MTRSPLSSAVVASATLALAFAWLLVRVGADRHRGVGPNVNVRAAYAQTEVCDFECCRPMQLHLHAGAFALTDLQNEAPEVDITWTPITTTVADPHVPVHFRATYCAEHSVGCSQKYYYEGVIPVDGSTGGDAGVVPIGAWPDKSRIGACGQEGLSEDMPAIVHVWQAVNLPGRPPCGQSNNGPPFPYNGCFSDTDYDMYIARTIQPAYPQGSTQCFHSIEFKLRPQTDGYSPGADDPTVLVQHDYDDRESEGSQCPGPDEYELVDTPSWLVTRTDFEFVALNWMRECKLSSGEDPGGQRLETCIFGIFARIEP